MDFFNNLVYTTTTTSGIYTSPGDAITACNNLAGGGAATVRNWWWTTYSGTCSTEMAANSNLLNVDPLNDFVGSGTGSLTMNDVNFWGLRQTSSGPDTFSQGIDRSNVTVGSDVDLASAPFDRDINNNNRVIDLSSWEEGNATDTGTYLLDIGAFEFNLLDLAIDQYSPYTPVGVPGGVPTAADLPIFDEDNGNAGANSSPIIIDLNNAVRGGFGQLTFALQQLPTIYGTQCGSAYTDANRGSVLGQGINNGLLFYCPPQHFYTDTTRTPLESTTPPDPADFPGGVPGDPNNNLSGTVFTYADDDAWPDYIIYTYTISDESGAQEIGTVLIQINAVNDTALDAAPAIVLGDGTPEDDIFRVTGNVGTTIVLDIDAPPTESVQGVLRPFASFTNNYFLSELTNPEFNDTTNNIYRMDYPFTFSNAIIYDVGDGIISSLSLVNSRMEIGLNDNNTGSAIVSYTATDANGNPMEVRILVRAVSRIPVDVGLYDDASFVFDYRDAAGTTEGNWLAVNMPTAINNTIHRTNILDDTATFGFKNNSGFVLYMQGMGGAGSYFDIEIETTIPGSPPTITSVSLNTSGWSLLAGSSAVYEVTAGDFYCTTTGILNTAGGLSLTSIVNGFYNITCNNDSHVNPATYVVTVTNNLQGRFIVIDAFAIIDSTFGTNEPLNVGYHDVDSLQVRNIFTANWSEIRSGLYTNVIAMRTLDANPPDLTFAVTGGSGFALGTTLQPISGTYTICVANRGTGATTCQDFNNTPDPITPFRNRVFRPFYGLDPSVIYDVTITNVNLNVNGQFVIDSIVVFDPTMPPEAMVSGVVEADELEYFAYGGGVEESWRLNLRDFTATEQSSIGLTPGVPGAGPYIGFEIDEALSIIYYSYSEVYVSQQAMICVDRGAGAGTSIADGYGNCLKVNLFTGDYTAINDDGTDGTSGNMKVSTGTIRIDETLFSRPWLGTDTDGIAGIDAHIIEIFSLHDRRLYVDRLIAIGDTVPLTAGKYEEYTENIDYLIPDGGGAYIAATIDPHTSPAPALYTGNFTQVTGVGALYDSSRGIMYTEEVGNVITFEINGTGFAPMIRFARDGGAINICWLSYAGAVPAPETVLSSGTCQNYDTESLYVGRNVPRPIMGLPSDTYAVAIEFLGDNFDTRNLFPTSVLWFDGVTVYDEDLSTRLNTLETGMTYEGNFNTEFTANNFAYFGSAWRYLASPVYATYSNRDFDFINVNAGGATVAFKTSGANVIVLDRPLRTGYAPLYMCAQEVGVASNRSCGLVDPTGIGFRNEFTFQLPSNGTYIVTLTDLNGGIFYFDAVRPVLAANVLTAGKYDDDNPSIMYDRSAQNLVRNGNMERLNTTEISYWTDTGAATSDRYLFIRYTPNYSRRVMANGGGGIQSLPFTLTDGSTYNFVGYVYIPSTTGGTVTVDIETSDGVTNVFSTTVTEVNKWIPVHFNFTRASDLADVVVRFTGSSGATFYVDDVDISEGSNWQSVWNRALYYGEYVTVNKSRGAEAAFRFTGTGFALGVPTHSLTGGEMRVCWLPDAGGTATNADVIGTGTCMTYQQQAFAVIYNNIRTITGLSLDTYRVVISDVEDGRMNHPHPLLVGNARNAAFGVGTITLDWVEIFNEVPPVIPSGVYSESATTGTGERALMVQPADRWNTFSGPTFVAYSDLSYLGAVNPLNLLDPLASGQAATVNLNIADTQSATVIFDVWQAVPSASDQLLACVGEPEGEFYFDGTSYAFQDTNGVQNCALLSDLRTNRYITLNKDILPLLENTTGSAVNRTDHYNLNTRSAAD
ncbi:MAG: hypothetical protein Q9P01_12895 [Anaerolineae bacterium]|nr:hypothetical protein [Anaerolineae bacterium]